MSGRIDREVPDGLGHFTAPALAEYRSPVSSRRFSRTSNRTGEDPMASSYVVERSRTIDAAPEAVYARIANFREWQAWSPWEDLDPNMAKTYGGTDGEVGSTYSWQGNRKAGQGTMTLAKLTPPTAVSIDLQFLKPFKSRSTTAFDVAPEGEGTRVTWTMTGDHTVLSRIMGIFVSMDKMIGKDFDKGLDRLKAVSEA
jgi:hypothetical protein